MEISAKCCGNGFLGLIIEDKGNLSGPARLEVILTIRLENFSSHLLFFFLLELLTNLLFIPSGLTKGNQVTMGHYKEIFQSSANESARKY